MNSTCTNPQHLHVYEAGTEVCAHHAPDSDRCANDPLMAVLSAPAPMLCGDCSRPIHYDRAIEWYVHDDPDAPGCFLIHGRYDDATPCS